MSTGAVWNLLKRLLGNKQEEERRTTHAAAIAKVKIAGERDPLVYAEILKFLSAQRKMGRAETLVAIERQKLGVKDHE